MNELNTMVEPRYSSLSEKLEYLRNTVKIPEIADLVAETHIRLRNQIGCVTGVIELAWRRGYQAGYEDGVRGAARQ